jgi:hypothetical protein
MLSALCGGMELRVLRILQSGHHDLRGFSIRHAEVTDLPRQIGNLMPNRVLEAPTQTVELDEMLHRMREPYHSMYLLWLARHPLAERLFTEGIQIDDDGRLACFDTI